MNTSFIYHRRVVDALTIYRKMVAVKSDFSSSGRVGPPIFCSKLSG
jgi:hypothetical protein